MSGSKDGVPAELPPSYQVATSTGSSTRPTNNASSHLEVPQGRNGIPVARRRSMEDESRPLPAGWVRQFDTTENHQFFVDTHATPPRSIWHHPYDDDEYLKTLSSEERERLQAEEHDRKRPITPASIVDDKKDNHSSTSQPHSYPELPPRPDRRTASTSGTSGGKHGFGSKLKDKLTGTTKEERELERARRAEEERQYYEAHQKFRAAMQRAQMTGQPQLLGKDKDGKDVYIEPPQPGYGGYGGGYPGDGYGYNPYSQGPYANPNARYVRPGYGYTRPYGGGFGGGYGLPLAGGLLGGALLGGLLF